MFVSGSDLDHRGRRRLKGTIHDDSVADSAMARIGPTWLLQGKGTRTGGIASFPIFAFAQYPPWLLHSARQARVAKLADALDLGSCTLIGVGVRLPPLAIRCELASRRSISSGGLYVLTGSCWRNCSHRDQATHDRPTRCKRYRAERITTELSAGL